MWDILIWRMFDVLGASVCLPVSMFVCVSECLSLSIYACVYRTISLPLYVVHMFGHTKCLYYVLNVCNLSRMSVLYPEHLCYVTNTCIM